MLNKRTITLNEILDSLGVEETQTWLSHIYRCERNSDVERFLLQKAVRFELAGAAATHFILNEKQQVLAYFSLSFKSLELNASKSLLRKLSGGLGDSKLIKAFLIGQVGKNDLIPSSITLSDILDIIFETLHQAKRLISGRVVILECENNPKLISLYEKHGFRLLEIKENQHLKTMFIIPRFKEK